MTGTQVISLGELDCRRLEALLRRRYVGGGGINVETSPDGAMVSISLAGQAAPQPGGEIMDAKILAATAINGAVR